MGKLRSIYVAILLILASSSSNAQHMQVAGYSLAYPRDSVQTPSEIRFPFMTQERMLSLQLNISKKGKLEGVTPDDESDSLLAAYCRKAMSKSRFEPARFEGKKVNSNIGIKALFEPGQNRLQLFFPIDHEGQVNDRSLYENSYRANGIEPAELISFPSFYCDLDWSDSLEQSPFVLIKVTLDSTGQLIAFEELFSTYPTFTMTISSAALYAQYRPMKVMGRPTESVNFLKVSFYPQLGYPTLPWQQKSSNDYSILRKAQVQFFPDTVGMLDFPLPAFLPGDFYTDSGPHQMYQDTVFVTLSIDDRGKPAIRRFSKTSQEIRNALFESVSSIRFYPALDYAGNSHQFIGLAEFMYDGSAKIRIDYKWLR